MSWTIGYGFKRRSYILYHNSRHFFGTQWAGGVVLLVPRIGVQPSGQERTAG